MVRLNDRIQVAMSRAENPNRGFIELELEIQMNMVRMTI